MEQRCWDKTETGVKFSVHLELINYFFFANSSGVDFMLWNNQVIDNNNNIKAKEVIEIKNK